MILCPCCKDPNKGPADFNRDSQRGRQRYCKDCQRAKVKAWRLANPERYQRYQREYRAL